MSKSVLITGAAGFIGSNLVARAQEEGWDITAVDDMSNGHKEFLHEDMQRRLLPMCFSSGQVIRQVVRQQFDAVVHLAAIPRVSYSVEHPMETHDINVTRTLQLIDACKGNVDRFIFASSSSVYGGAEDLPTAETAPRDPKSPYALQKAIIEDYLHMYYEFYELDSVALRFFNVFGPNQLGDSPYSCAVAAWLAAIHRGESMRSDGDGSQSRDLCHVDNVVDCCVRAVDSTVNLKAEPINVACGDRASNMQILKCLQKWYPDAKYHEAPWRPGDVMHTQADISKAERLLGYTPLVRFWDGLEKTIKWSEDNVDLVTGLRSAM